MATKVEDRMTPQGKKYLCLVMGDGQFPPNISLRTAEAVLQHLDDVKQFVAQKVALCSRFGVPLPQGQPTQSVSNWQQGVPSPNSYPPQGQSWQGSPNQYAANVPALPQVPPPHNPEIPF